MKLLENKFLYKIRYGLIASMMIIVVLFWDILLKIITDGFNITIIPNFFYFISTYNTGAAYGIFSGNTLMLSIFSIVMVIGLIIYNYFKKNKTIFYSISMGLIIGGAIGNLIDRLFLGYVRDFIKFSFFSPTFNIADACLTIGVICFAIFIIFFDTTFKKKNDLTKIENNINKNINSDVIFSENKKEKTTITLENDDDK